MEKNSQQLAVEYFPETNMRDDASDRLEKLKKTIIDPKTEIVSFDIFDTLVVRPFLLPSDMFFLLDKEFKEQEGRFRLQSFHDIRIKSEAIAREENASSEDVTLDMIYGIMQKEFAVEGSVAGVMLSRELEYEIRYCSQRKTAKILYDLALRAGKKIIITSDMYLPKDAIVSILKNSGYKNYDELYVSSHHGKMKATQNLYKHITEELSVSPNSILHIGDNYESDVVAAKAAGWKAVHFPKATEAWGVFEKIFCDNADYARNHLGVRVSYALAANEYFDNPYRKFDKNSLFNGSSYLVGYFALGLSILGFTRWMIDDMKTKGIESITFLGRDGYLPMRAFEMFSHKLDLPTSIHYLPTSRKATIPLALLNPVNISDIATFNHRGVLNDSIKSVLKPFMKDEAENIDYAKLDELRAAFVATYRSYFGKNSAVMDIGYSGRPEQLFAHLFNTPIETYFMYTGSDEARRRLGKKVNVYGRTKVAGLREKMISEIGPSCTGYRLAGDRVEPVFEKKVGLSKYEKNLISSIQGAAIDFVQAYLHYFADHFECMDLGDNLLTLQPLDKATVTPTQPDREIFRGIVHEDSVAGEAMIDLFDAYYTTDDRMDHLQLENSRLASELQSYMGVKRSARLLLGNVRRRIQYGKDR